MDVKLILAFLAELRRNNNREWFAAHKDRYLEVKAQVESLTMQLIAAVSEVEPDAARLRVSDCTYRIYRDTRFSLDKTPYKTHIGIFVNPPAGKKSVTLGWYLHLEPGNCFFAAGTVCHPPKVLKAIRRFIYEEIEEYRDIVEDLEFRKLYPNIGDNALKTVPKGFPRDWDHLDYIRPRDYVAYSSLSENFVTSPDLVARLAPHIAQGHRFNRFINYAISESQEEENFKDI